MEMKMIEDEAEPLKDMRRKRMRTKIRQTQNWERENKSWPLWYLMKEEIRGEDYNYVEEREEEEEEEESLKEGRGGNKMLKIMERKKMTQSS
jgi:hypothetical protein